MYRTLIAAVAFAAISAGAITTSHAQASRLPESNAPGEFSARPGEEVQGEATNEEREAQDVQPEERMWVWVNSCWSRWRYVGNNIFGRPLYRRYVWCR